MEQHNNILCYLDSYSLRKERTQVTSFGNFPKIPQRSLKLLLGSNQSTDNPGDISVSFKKQLLLYLVFILGNNSLAQLQVKNTDTEVILILVNVANVYRSILTTNHNGGCRVQFEVY